MFPFTFSKWVTNCIEFLRWTLFDCFLSFFLFRNNISRYIMLWMNFSKLLLKDTTYQNFAQSSRRQQKREQPIHIHCLKNFRYLWFFWLAVSVRLFIHYFFVIISLCPLFYLKKSWLYSILRHIGNISAI